MKQSEALAAAFIKLAAGFTALATAVKSGDFSAADKATTDELKALVEEEDDEPAVKPTKKPKGEAAVPVATKTAKATPPAEKAIPAKVRKALDALDLDEATRPELKAIADALGIDTQGKRASELRDALKPYKGAKTDAEDITPEDDDDEEEVAVEYPDKKVMRKELKQFCAANKEDIEGVIPEFFDDSEDAEDPKERLHQIVADEALLKEYWKDNVYTLKQAGQWEETVREAAEAVN